MASSTTDFGVDGLFRRWRELLEAGELPTAIQIAADQPELAEPLQQRINDHFSLAADHLGETWTVAGAALERSPPPPPEVPGLLVLDLLGRGGNGYVYRVRDSLGREWALKQARQDRASANSRVRFFDEAMAMAQLKHPHIVNVHEYRVHEGTQYIQMPIYPASLNQKLPEFQVDARKAVALMVKVAMAVGYLHEKKLIHRDLKPHNILLDAAGEPALADFGLIKPLSGDDTVTDEKARSSVQPSNDTKQSGANRSRTVVGAILGTLSYMHPQQAAGLIQMASPTWDVYALGVMLHELLTGQLPASSQHPERLLDPATPDDLAPSNVKPGLDRKLERIVQKCLARDPADRYQDAREVVKDLTAWLGPDEAVRRARRQKSIVRIAVSVVVALVLVAVAAAIFRRTPEQKLADAKASLIARIDKGATVTLIPSGGRPGYHRVLAARDGFDPVQRGKDFVVTTNDTALIELVPAEAVHGPFTITGRVKYLKQGDDNSRAGFYYSHNPGSAPEGPDHTFAHLSYIEYLSTADRMFPKLVIPPGQKVLLFGVQATHWVNLDEGRLPQGTSAGLTYQTFMAPWNGPLPGNPWRDLELRVTDALATGTFEGKPFGTEDHALLGAAWRPPEGIFPPRPPFGTAGGIGLYIQNATIAFEDIVFRPTAD